jgi:hypothetical protein
MLSQPRGEELVDPGAIGFSVHVDHPAREGNQGIIRKPRAVDLEERCARAECRALVAIEERMIEREPVAQRRGLVEEIAVGVVRHGLCARDGRLEQRSAIATQDGTRITQPFEIALGVGEDLVWRQIADRLRHITLRAT